MPPGDAVATERVYQALRLAILEGQYGLGERIDLRQLADHYRTSVTPVRDAVHRLLGEQLVESHARGGYQVPLFTRERLIELYNWNAILAQTACTAHLSSPRMAAPIPEATDHNASLLNSRLATSLFLAISDALGSQFHRASVSRVNELLHAARRIEASLFTDAVEETRLLCRLWTAKSNIFPRSLQRYHARRISASSSIISEIHSLHGNRPMDHR